MASSEIRAGKAYVEIGTKNSGLDAGFLSARRHLGSFVDSVRGAELKLRNFSVSARNLGLDLIKLGVVLGTPVVFSVKQFADFEKQLARISTFLKNPQELMPKFKSEILKLSDEFGIAATEMANGLAEILSANIPASESFEFLKQAMKGAVGNAVEFKDQLSGLITFMQAFQGSGLTAARATELLRVAVEEGRIPANDLANTMGMVASKMAQAGGSAEELIATYSALSTTGLSVSEQTTMFRGILTAFSDASPETAKEFVRLSKAVTGIAQPMTLANLRTQGFTKTLEWLSKLSPDDLGKIFKDVRAANGIIVLSSKMDLYKRSLEAARGRANLADKAFETMSSTLAHLGEKIVTVGKNLAIQFGEVLLGTLKEVGNALIEIGNIVSAFIKANPQLAITLTKIAVTAAAVGSVLLGLGLTFSIMSTALSGLVAIGGVVVGVFTTIFGIIGSLLSFLFSWSGAIVAIGVALTTTFVNVGGFFEKLSDGVKSGFESLSVVFERFKNSIVETFELVKRAVAAKNYDLAVKLVINKIKILWYQAVEDIATKYNELKTKFASVILSLKERVADWTGFILTKLTELTTLSVFKDISNLFSEAFQDMDGTLEGFQRTWVRVWASMHEFALTVIKKVQDGWDNIKLAAQTHRGILGGRTEGDIAMAKADFTDAVKKYGSSSDKENLSELIRLSEAIYKTNSILDDKTISPDARKNFTEVLNDQQNALKIVTDDLKRASFWWKTNGMAAESGAVARKNLDLGFKPLDEFERDVFSTLGSIEQEKAARELKYQEDIANINKKKTAALANISNETEEERLRKLNESFGNTPFSDPARQRRILEREAENELKRKLKESEDAKKISDLVFGLNEKFGNFWEKTFAQDAKVPNDKTDISAIEIEKKKIRDGVLGAFNVNALGNYGAGDVMKSVKELLEEAARRDLERKQMLDEDLKTQKKIEQNTKQQFRFSGGI